MESRFRALAVISLCILALGFSGCATTSRYVHVEKVNVRHETGKGHVTKVHKTMERADRNVIENSTNVKNVTRISNFNIRAGKNRKDIKQFDKFDISPEGDKLLMPIMEVAGKKAIAQIWTLGTNGMGLTKVTSGKYLDMDPVFSPDSKYIYFSSNRGEEKSKIWRLFATGTGGLTRVTSSSTADRAPNVAPSAQMLLYSALMPGATEWQIWTVNTNGALPTQFVAGETPVFSPDGKKILFTKQNPDTLRNDLWVMSADGSNRTQMTTGDSTCADPRWSPDGNRIVYASDKGLDEEQKHNFDIWMMNADGTNLTQLTTNGSYDDMPVFDPDGEYIYFRSNRGGGWDIWRGELNNEFPEGSSQSSSLN